MRRKTGAKDTGLPETQQHRWAGLAHAVLRVGDFGRGFVVQRYGDRRIREHIVLTAAQCLPFLPSSRAHLGERIYKWVLGPLGLETAVWADCQFIDPIANIAVLAATSIAVRFSRERTPRRPGGQPLGQAQAPARRSGRVAAEFQALPRRNA